MCDDCPNTKPRFKGVENFLRRIAFNLGNSPSQTDVKIISCIPIDVTDLQQKICDLERVVTRLHKPQAIVHTALCEPVPCEAQPSTIQECPTDMSKDAKYEEEQPIVTVTISKCGVMDPPPQHLTKNPEENFVDPSQSSISLNYLNKNTEKSKRTFLKKSRKKSEKKWTNKPRSHMVYYAQTDNSPFKLRHPNKKTAKVSKHSENTDIRKEPKIQNNTTKKTKVSSSLTAVVRKQYGPSMYHIPGGSEFSSPICRDIEHSVSAPNTRSDICSCCHMDFLNIDKDRIDYGFTPTFQDQIKSQNIYYDSSLYDLVPVKEAPIKLNKNLDHTKMKKQYRNEFDFSDFIDYHANRPYDRAMFVNYHTTTPTTMPPPHVIPQSIPRPTNTRTHCKQRPLHRRTDYNNPIEKIQEVISNSCGVECGNVYRKITNKKHETLKKIEVVKNTVTYNDAETITINNSECQTVTTQNVETELSQSDGKTEETLNQIKSILQSVLTEVKTNGKIKPEERAKKDAVVQKGPSFGILPGSSRLLHSFSYGAYNSGHYMASCSHQINSGQYWPRMPYSPKCVHNFPVFIQTPGRIPYSACYRNNSHVSKPSAPRPQRCAEPPRKATSAATNTDEHDKSHETETLIKEIYKSIALNIHAPKKDISTSNCSSIWKRSSRISTKSSNRTDIKSLDAKHAYPLPKPAYDRRLSDAATLSQFGSSILRQDSQSIKRREVINSLPLTPFSSNTFSNKMTSNTMSVQSRAIHSIDTDRRTRNTYKRHYLNTTMETPSEEEDTTQTLRTQAERRTDTATTAAISSTSSSSEDSEQSDLRVRRTIGPAAVKTETPKKQRTNLFTKMIKSVKLFKNKKKKSQIFNIDSEEEESDSDDYQTIYSQQVKPPPKLPIQIHIPARKIPHSKVSYSRQMRGRNHEKQQRRMSLEQEYRKQWNDELVFQQRPRNSTDHSMRPSYKGPQRRKQYTEPQMQLYMPPYKQPAKRPVTRPEQPPTKPPYYRKPVMVEQSIPVQNTMFQDILTALPKMKARRPAQFANEPPGPLSWFKKRIHSGQNSFGA